MRTTNRSTSRQPESNVYDRSAAVVLAAFVGMLAICSADARGQAIVDLEATGLSGAVSSSAMSLPEAPTPATLMLPAGISGQKPSVPQPRVATTADDVIDPSQTAPRLSVGDKVLMGVRGSVSPFAVIGWIASAGYEQAVNGSPNYGQTGKGFAQRLGAAAARDTSEDLLTTSVVAPILHEDPRYYKMGNSHNFVVRVFYAGTRPLITRTDGGRQTLNFATILGNLGGSAITPLYYPPGNRNLDQVLETFGGSMGGSAIGSLASEFLGRASDLLLLKKEHH